MWTKNGMSFTHTTLQTFDVSSSMHSNSYWRHTGGIDKEEMAE